MEKTKSRVIKLGLFVSVAIILFTIGIYNIGNQQNMFGNQFMLSSKFKNVNGLQAGSNVRYSGINVGIVQQILIINDSTLEVQMKIQKEVQNHLKKDAIVSIGTDGLVGNMIVNITAGKGDGAQVEDGDVLQSYARVEAEDMLNTLGNTTENIALLTLNLLEIAESINSGSGSASMLINDDILARDLLSAIRHIKNAAQKVNSLSGQLQKTIQEVDEGEGVLGYLLKDSTFERQMAQITTHLDTLIHHRTVPIMSNLESASHSIAQSGTDLNQLIQQLDFNQGLVGTLLKDSLITEDLKQTMQNLNQGTDRFNQNMEALKHNFLFRKYFKKKEKQRNKEVEQATVMKK